MRRVLYLVPFCALAIATAGCVDAHLKMGRAANPPFVPAAPTADQHTIDNLVCWGREVEAERQLERLGIAPAAATDRLIAAEEMARKPGSGCCALPGCPGQPSPPPDTTIPPFDGDKH